MAATYTTPGVYIEEQRSGSMPDRGRGHRPSRPSSASPRRTTPEQGTRRTRLGRQAPAGHQLAAVRAGLRRLRDGARAAARRQGLLRQRRRAPATSSASRARRTGTAPTAARSAASCLPLCSEPACRACSCRSGRRRRARRGRGRRRPRRPRAAEPLAGLHPAGLQGRARSGGGDRAQLHQVRRAALERTVKDQSRLITLQRAAGAGRRRSPTWRRPRGRYALETTSTVAVRSSISPAEVEGSEAERTGYQGLAIAEDVTMVAIPDLLTVATREDGTVDEELYLVDPGQARRLVRGWARHGWRSWTPRPG